MKKTYVMISSILSMIMIWYILFYAIDEALIMPSFHDVLSSISHILFSSDILILLHSLLRLIVSFTVAAILGVLFGYISAKKQFIEIFAKPYVTILRTIPVLSIVVMIYILVGSNVAVYLITFLMIFPLFYQSTIHIIKTIDPALIDVLKLNESKHLESMKYVYIPILKEGLFVTIFQSLGLGVKVLVMAEYLMQTNHSIGQSIYLAKANLSYDLVYGWTILLVTMTLILEVYIQKIQNKISK